MMSIAKEDGNELKSDYFGVYYIVYTFNILNVCLQITTKKNRSHNAEYKIKRLRDFGKQKWLFPMFGVVKQLYNFIPLKR